MKRRDPNPLSRAVPRTGNVGASPMACGRCGDRYDRAAWQQLAFVSKLDPLEISRVIRHWPANACIEVRRCVRCANELARRAAVLDPGRSGDGL
jgi:hypothetical protein